MMPSEIIGQVDRLQVAAGGPRRRRHRRHDRRAHPQPARPRADGDSICPARARTRERSDEIRSASLRACSAGRTTRQTHRLAGRRPSTRSATSGATASKCSVTCRRAPGASNGVLVPPSSARRCSSRSAFAKAATSPCSSGRATSVDINITGLYSKFKADNSNDNFLAWGPRALGGGGTLTNATIVGDTAVAGTIRSANSGTSGLRASCTTRSTASPRRRRVDRLRCDVPPERRLDAALQGRLHEGGGQHR